MHKYFWRVRRKRVCLAFYNQYPSALALKNLEAVFLLVNTEHVLINSCWGCMKNVTTVTTYLVKPSTDCSLLCHTFIR